MKGALVIQMVYTMDMISLFWGTDLLSGGTTLKPRNINTLIRAVRSGRLFLKQTKTFSHSSFSSANSSREMKLSLEPSGNILVGISTYKVLLISSVFHSNSFSSLKGHLKLTKRDSAISARSSKSINSVGLLVSILSFNELLDDPVDVLKFLDRFDDSEVVLDVVLEYGTISLFRLPTLPLIIPPSESMNRSCCSSISSAVLF